MPKNDHLNGCLDDIDVDVMEREATPQLLMKLGIQLHLAGLSLSIPCLFLMSSVLNGLVRPFTIGFIRPIDSPRMGRRPDHVAVDETVIRLNDEQYWLYAAVDPETNKVLHTTLEPTTTTVIAQSFLTELSEKHAGDTAVCLVDGSHSVQDACHRHGVDVRYERHGNRNSVERVFREVKRRTSSFSHCFSNASADTVEEWLRSFAFAWNQLI